ncbi:hypothetical protein BpHYR1_007592, partial [Brachionus plicatilis]
MNKNFNKTCQRRENTNIIILIGVANAGDELVARKVEVDVDGPSVAPTVVFNEETKVVPRVVSD